MPKSKLQTIALATAEAVEWQDIKAADGETTNTPQFTMLAYTGVALKPYSWSTPVIVDLSGIKAAKTIPIFRGHDSDRIVGHGTAVISDDDVRVSGVISADNEHAREVISSSRNGFPWQASIGASIVEYDRIESDQTAKVNGTTVKGPVIIARKTVLNEVSFVPLGADRKTSAKVAAQATQHPTESTEMEFEAWLSEMGLEADGLTEKARTTLRERFDAEQSPTPRDKTQGSGAGSFRTMVAERKEEQARIRAINATAQRYIDDYPEYLDDIEKIVNASHGDRTVDEKDVRLQLIEATRPIGVQPWRTKGGKDDCGQKVIEAAICKSLGVTTVEKDYDERTLESADRHFPRGIGLQQLLFRAAAAHGRHFDSAADTFALLRAAFGQDIKAQGWSTFSLPGILSNVMNKTLLNIFNEVTDAYGEGDETPVWRQICAVDSVRNFHAHNYYGLTDDLTYKPLPRNGEITHGTVGETSYTNQADVMARMLAVDYRDIVNDDLGALQKVPQRLALGSARAIMDQFWATFLNNSAFFAVGNNNVASGAFDATGAALSAAAEVFSEMRDPQGNKMRTRPRILLVPPGSYDLGKRLMESDYTVGGSSNVADRNVYKGRYKLLSSTYMNDSNFTGYSDVAWYLLGDPKLVPVIQVVFLNGREVPVIEVDDTSFNTLGIQFRGHHSFGVALMEPRGGVRGSGAD